jgi:hypothetical protein
VNGLPQIEEETSVCEACLAGKEHRLKFDLIHSNVCGPMRTQSVGGAKYFITIIYDLKKKNMCISFEL